jgi:zinc protease
VLETPDYLNTYVANIQAVTPEDIRRVAELYLRPELRTVGWVLPENPDVERETKIIPDEAVAPMPSDMVFHPAPEANDGSQLPGSPTMSGEPPSSSDPASSSVPLSTPPMSAASRWVLDNGLTVLYLQHTHLPVVAIEAFIDAGQVYEPESKAGVAALTGRLLDEGTLHRSAFEIAESIECMGGTLHTKSRGAAVQVLAEYLPEALEIMADVLKFPEFAPQEIEKERRRTLAMLESDGDTPSVAGYYLFNEMVYGTHPYHRPSKGYTHTVSALNRDDILDYYTTYFVPNNTILAIVGNVAADDAFEHVNRSFGNWPFQALPSAPNLAITSPTARVVQSLPRDKAQAHVYLGHPGITRMNPDYYAALVMEHVLGTGPGFTDRISRKLRDEQGLAYTVYANLTMTAEIEPGTFMAYIGTSPENTTRAIEGVLHEIRELQKVLVPSEELDVVKEYLTGSYIFSFETTMQLAHYLIDAERFQLGQDFLHQYPQKIHQVTCEDVMRVAQHYLDPDNYYVALVGTSDMP